MATIKDLAARKTKLEADLAKVNAEIKARHGEVDDPESKKPARKKVKDRVESVSLGERNS